jgi:segregation and condensation protein A
MAEKTISWWRRALEFTLGGFRFGFGFFSRPARPEPVPKPMVSSSIQESPEEDRALTEPSPTTEIAADTPAVPVEAEVELPSKPEPVAVAEEAPLAETAPDPSTAIDLTAAGNAVPDEGEETTGELGISGETSGIRSSGDKWMGLNPSLPARVDSVGIMRGLKFHPSEQRSLAGDPGKPPPPSESNFPATSLATGGMEAEVVDESALEPVEEAEPVVEAEAVKEAVEEPLEASESELEVEAPVEPEVAETHEDEAVNEVAEEPVGELEAVIEAEPEAAAEPVSDPAIEPVTPVAEPISAPAIEPAALAAEPSAVTEPEPVSAPDIEPVATVAVPSAAVEPSAVVEPEPTPEPVTVPVPAANTVPQRALKPQPSAEAKEAARLAARQKKLDEGSEESPFSVIVGQVYDGPLDLLLDLIRKQDIDIYDIPIAIITSRFLAYVNQLKASDIDVAGDFIYTASLLIHIKSKMLLPHAEAGPEQAAEDPRRELVERLLEHERFKNAARMLQQKQMLEAATWSNPGVREFKDDEATEPEIAADTVDLVRIFREILERARNRPVIDVEEDSVTVGQMIQFLARRLTMEDKPVALRRLLSHTRSERALIAMFLALLEMVRLQAILLRQDRQFSEIFIKKHSGFDAVMNEGLGNARDDWR